MSSYAVKVAVLEASGGWLQQLFDCGSLGDALDLFSRSISAEAPEPALVELVADGRAVLFASSFIPGRQYGCLALAEGEC